MNHKRRPLPKGEVGAPRWSHGQIWNSTLITEGRARPDGSWGGIEMKKPIIGSAVFVVAVVALRRFGPALGERAMRKCEGMFDRMPEEFPPKRMMRNVEEIRDQNSEILRRFGTPTSVAGAGGR